MDQVTDEYDDVIPKSATTWPIWVWKKKAPTGKLPMN